MSLYELRQAAKLFADRYVAKLNLSKCKLLRSELNLLKVKNRMAKNQSRQR